MVDDELGLMIGIELRIGVCIGVLATVLFLSGVTVTTSATILSGHATASERPFVEAMRKDLSQRFPTPASAIRAGYIRYTGVDSTGAISYADLHWTSADPKHPSQLWYDSHGHLLGADFSKLKRDYPKQPHLWGVDPSRWFEQSAHVHYVIKEPGRPTVYGYVIPPSRLLAVGGNPNEPTAKDIVNLKLARTKKDVLVTFLFPNIWDIEVWILKNPDGAFAQNNPLVTSFARPVPLARTVRALFAGKAHNPTASAVRVPVGCNRS